MTAATPPSRPAEVFISYSHRDEALKDELIVHLAILRRQKRISTWHDRRIGPGAEWAGQIDAHLNSADVILLLISPDFLASDYCYDVEMGRALERHDAGSARVIPVILRPCDWKGAPFGKLQALPTDAKPITRWADRDEALTVVAQGIRSVVEELSGRSGSPTPPATRAKSSPVGASSAIHSETEWETGTRVGSSGDLLLLDGRIYKAEAARELSNGSFEVQIAPGHSKEDAALRSLRGDRYGRREKVSFAYGDQAFLAEVVDASSHSTGGKTTWTLVLTPQESHANPMSDVHYNGLTPDQQAEMRARMLLLDERPSPWLAQPDRFLLSFVQGPLEKLGLKGGLFPILAQSWSGSETDRLRQARLWAVFFLKVSDVCEHVLELSLGPIRGGKLSVRFRGRRRRVYSNVAPSEIAVEGESPL